MFSASLLNVDLQGRREEGVKPGHAGNPSCRRGRFFSHPDSTVGHGIAPCLRSLPDPLADFTAGKEFHLALKKTSAHNITRISEFAKYDSAFFAEKKAQEPPAYAKKQDVPCRRCRKSSAGNREKIGRHNRKKEVSSPHRPSAFRHLSFVHANAAKYQCR